MTLYSYPRCSHYWKKFTTLILLMLGLAVFNVLKSALSMNKQIMVMKYG